MTQMDYSTWIPEEGQRLSRVPLTALYEALKQVKDGRKKEGCRYSLAQRSVAEKENEITAVKELLTPVYVKDRVWTADAMHTQKTACQCIDQFGGKYLLFFKDNHPTAHEDLALFFQDPDADQSTWGFFSHTDKGHGRLTTRTVRTTTEMNDWFANEWAGIGQTFQVIRTVKRKRRKVIDQPEAQQQTPTAQQATPG